ncbi:carbohydrate ABC transporter permease [Paenibacillus sp. LjRoot56]|uniref:carbohydrate ABC transporter permease n=1 Tax=Paenibacillus sp. LjRoot56 TaxID=3342333 RepID=UPI003ECE172A
MKKLSMADRIMDGCIYFLLISFSIITLVPFINIFNKAVSEEWAVVSGQVGLLPVGFQLETMTFVITSATFLRSFQVSVFITVVGTLMSLIITALTAYPLSKKQLKGGKILLVLFVFTMLFNGGIIPNYLLIRQLGLINNVWSLILPSMLSVFNLLVIKSYYESLPESLEESAKMDGARYGTILFRIILPLSGPVLATIALFYAVQYWNDFFNAMLYVSDPKLKPLQLYLRDIVMDASNLREDRKLDDVMNVTPEGIRSATVIASTVPILLVYPFLQRYFIKGVLIGSVKG